MKKITMVALLSALLCLTGCVPDNEILYGGENDVRIDVSSEKKMARIEIIDTYTKGDVRYYVFKTDISDDKEFLLSEREFDEYIGLNNDAVDCIAYKLTYAADIVTFPSKIFGINIMPGVSLETFFSENNIKAMECVQNDFYNVDCISRVDIFSAEDFSLDFSKGDEFAVDYEYENEISFGFYETCTLSSYANITRYSFVGEEMFTETEITAHKDVIAKVNNIIIDYSTSF